MRSKREVGDSGGGESELVSLYEKVYSREDVEIGSDRLT